MEPQEQLVQELAWLRRVVIGLVGDDAAAGDLTQEVALEALRRPPVTGGAALEGARLRGWLWTIARRKAGRSRERSALRTESESRVARPDAAETASRSAQQLELHRDLLDEIRALDADDASLITQRYLDRRPPHEIARAMNLPVPTLRKRLSRAMERLRRRLVESDRGAEGWSLGLCLIVGSQGGAVPVGAGPRRAGGAEAPTYLGGGAALKWAALALLLTGVSAALVWIVRSPDERERPDLGALALLEREAIGGGDPESLAIEGEPRTATREAVAVAEATGLAQDAAPAAPQPSSTLRFVDESGAPLGLARAVWADEDWTPHALEIDASGLARLPRDARGYVYAGGDGFENQEFQIAWSDAGDMEVMLRRQRQIPGRLLIDGLAPGREVILWQGRYSTNDWPNAINFDERMKAALDESDIAWTRGPLKTTADGHFVYTTNATWYDYFLSLPADLKLIRAEGFFRAESGQRGLRLMSDSEELLIEATTVECLTGRLVWQDDGRPFTGLVGMFPLDEQGEWIAQVNTFVDPDGRFLLPLYVEPTYDDGEGEGWQAFEVHLDDLRVTHRLDRPGEAYDVGTIELPRAPWAHLQILGHGERGTVPLLAVAASEFEEALSGDSGVVKVHAAIGSTVRILAEGYGYREVTIASQAAFASTPQVVELDPAQRLRVRFALSHRVGFDPEDSVKVVLRMRAAAFEGEAVSEETSNRFWRAYRLLVGQRAQGFRAEGDDWGLSAGEAFFQGVPGRDLWIDGLRLGSSFDVEVQDRLGQILGKEPVTMPLAVGEPAPLVDFGDLYETGAAAVELTLLDPRSGAPYWGPVFIVDPGSGRAKSERTDESGRLALGPLLPGQYYFAASSKGSPRKGEGVQVTLNEGLNQLTIQAIGR